MNRGRCIHTLLRMSPLLLMLSASVEAQEYVFETNNGTITITQYTGPGGAVTIPTNLGGLTVTDIEGAAFENSASLTSVIVPGTVTNIGPFAFDFCTNLASVTLSSGVTTLGDWSFAFCLSLSNLTVPGSLSNLGSFAFSRCVSLPAFAIPNGVTNIGAGTFSYCSSLTNVTIPGTVTSIADSAFSSCLGLANITIPNGVADLGPFAFATCSNLKNISIPASVTNISAGVFFECSSLAAITVDSGNAAYAGVAGVLFDHDQTTLIQYPGGKPGSYSIPTTVTTVAGDAFAGGPGLTAVTVPQTVANLGFFAFGQCTNLTTITVDPANAFYHSAAGVLFDATSSTLIQYPAGRTGGYVIPDSVSSLEPDSFFDCQKLSSITIPNNVTSIGDAAFYGCAGLTNVVIPGSVTNFGNGTFSFCTNLNSVTVPGSVTNLGVQAFNNCLNLASVFFEGDAPVADPVDFDADSHATVYYLPGALGWSGMFAGRPAVLWNPQIQTGDASVGVRTNRFGFNVTGASNLVVVIAASTDLANPVWLPLQTNIPAGDSFYFSDPQWTNFATRFYGLRWP